MGREGKTATKFLVEVLKKTHNAEDIKEMNNPMKA